MTKKTNDRTGTAESIFAKFDEQYESKGLVGVPVAKTKKPLVDNWPKAGSLSPGERQKLREAHPTAGIGLLAGTALSSGRVFAFLDVDHDGFVPFIIAVMGGMLSGKKGQKGLTIFVQAEQGLTSIKIKCKGQKGYVVEAFINSGQTVMPPSWHPSGVRYQFVGKDLLDVEVIDLPILTSQKLELIKRVCSNRLAHEIVDGGAEVKAHDLMLGLTASGIASITDDFERLASCLNQLFHPEYKGDTREETLEMLRSAKSKKLGIGFRYEAGVVGPRPLGFTRDGSFALLDQSRNIIVSMTSNQLLAYQNLLGLAEVEFWANQFPHAEKMFNFFGAGLTLIDACRKAGPFNPLKVRGRGVWLEGDRVVINLGRTLPNDLQNLYLCFEPIPLQQVDSFEAQRLLDWLRLFKWRNPQDAMLLLGWLALAPICGVLTWRPHCFIYGPIRCGKTTIHSFVTHILHPLVLAVDGQSSEAGIRQATGPDSRPVAIDEFETDQHFTILRAVLRLARSASSADAAVLKGTPEGKAMQFSLRAMFFFSAVNPGNMTQADESRILLFELLMHDNDAGVARHIDEGERYFRTRGPEWCGYMASIAQLIDPTIDLFAHAMPGLDRRHRQNMATLLSGAFVSLHGRIPTPEEAEAWAAEYAPSVEVHAESLERDDAQEALDYLLAHVVEGNTLGYWRKL
jgi:hypothetical protein